MTTLLTTDYTERYVKFGSVKIPQKLLDAQANGELVIFVGAGISIQHGYPDYKSLSKQIVDGYITRGKNDTIEAFLGQLQDRGTRVHKLCIDIISRHKINRPSNRCKNLLNIASHNGQTHIITTNFDTLLSTAAYSLHIDPKEYIAPALPLGRSFSGIVYLHGNIEHEESQLVLTDIDFARAYITDGWARHFLTSVYENYTVLFVGYSHNDIIMRALARGLKSGTSRRYSLVPEKTNRREFWESMNIEPIEYSQTTRSNHSQLDLALTQWSSVAMMTKDDHFKRVSSIVVHDPDAISGEDSEYLKYVIGNRHLITLFTEKADNPKYLDWIYSHKLLTDRCIVDDRQHPLVKWACDRFSIRHFDHFGGIFHKANEMTVSYPWMYVFQALLIDNAHDDNVSVRTILAQMLIDKHQSAAQLRSLFNMVIMWPYQKYKGIIWSVFERASQITYTSDNGYLDVVTSIEPYHRKMFWENIAEPHMIELADPIASLMIMRIKQTYSTLVAMNLKWKADKPSYRRDVDGTDSMFHDNSFDVITDIIRDTMCWLAQNRSSRYYGYLKELVASEVPLLIRIAIHTVNMATQTSSDEKITWMIDEGLVYGYWYRPENYKLLMCHYPKSSIEKRGELVSFIIEGGGMMANENTVKPEINILDQLSKAAGGCQVADNAISQLSMANGGIEPDKYPLYDINIRVRGEQESDEAVDIRDHHPIYDYPWITREIIDNRRSYDYLDSLQIAVKMDVKWAHLLLHEMAIRHCPDKKIWISVLQGLACEILGDKEASYVKEFVAAHLSVIPPISTLRYVQTALKSHNVDYPTLSSIFTKIYPLVHGYFEPIPEDTNKRLYWITYHPIGIAIDIMIQLCVHLQTDTATLINYMNELEQFVSSESIEDKLLTSQICGFAYDLHQEYPKWTIANVIPMMDWCSESDEISINRWNAYLRHQRWCSVMEKELLAQHNQLIDHIYDFEPYDRTLIISYIANICIRSDDMNINVNWIRHFIEKMKPDERVEWTRCIGSLLSEYPDRHIEYWRRWIKQYLYGRLMGIPCTMGNDEINEVMNWVPLLESVFDDVVELFSKVDNISFKTPEGLLFQLTRCTWDADNAKSLAHFLTWILYHADDDTGPIYVTVGDYLIELVDILYRLDINNNDIIHILDRLYELNYISASIYQKTHIKIVSGQSEMENE